MRVNSLTKSLPRLSHKEFATQGLSWAYCSHGCFGTQGYLVLVGVCSLSLFFDTFMVFVCILMFYNYFEVYKYNFLRFKLFCTFMICYDLIEVKRISWKLTWIDHLACNFHASHSWFDLLIDCTNICDHCWV